jgi:hypothetical protein
MEVKSHVDNTDWNDSKAKQIIERRADRQNFAAEAIAPSRSDVFVSRKEKQNATSSFVEYEQ